MQSFLFLLRKHLLVWSWSSHFISPQVDCARNYTNTIRVYFFSPTKKTEMGNDFPPPLHRASSARNGQEVFTGFYHLDPHRKIPFTLFPPLHFCLGANHPSQIQTGTREGPKPSFCDYSLPGKTGIQKGQIKKGGSGLDAE